jgi:hypothetical protein
MDFTAFCTLTKPASEDVSVFVSLRVTQETTSNLAFTNSMFTITIGLYDLFLKCPKSKKGLYD